MRRFSVDGLALVCGMLAAIGSEASQLVPEVLRGLDQVALVTLVPRYEPIPGISPSDLERELRAVAVSVLSESGILTNPQAPQRLVVDVVCTASPAIHGSLAVLVMVRLEEVGDLPRLRSKPGAALFDVVTWSDFQLLVVPTDQARDPILDAASTCVAEFGAKVVQATHTTDKYQISTRYRESFIPEGSNR